MAVVLMSRAELSRVDTLARVDRGEVPVAEAASLLGLSERQVFRLLARFRSEGAAGLASRRRGRPSNRRCRTQVREAALASHPRALRRLRADAGGREAGRAPRPEARRARRVRRWMAGGGLWVPRKERRGRVHQPRHRRDCLGELVQIDGCEHHWFEDRGPPCTLAGLRRRRDQPADAAAVRAQPRVDLRLLGGQRATSRRTAGRSPSTRTSTHLPGQWPGPAATTA